MARRSVSIRILTVLALFAMCALAFGITRGGVGVQAAPGNPNYKLDHDKCWTVESPQVQPQIVLLQDQFDLDVIPGVASPSLNYEVVAVGQPDWFCNPTRKLVIDAAGNVVASAGITNINDHLSCYQIKELTPAGTQPQITPHPVEVTNQFGTFNMIANQPRDLCVPTQKATVDGNKPPVGGGQPSPDLDHFKCYDVFGPTPSVELKIEDQFDLFPPPGHFENVRLLEPVLLCNPTAKIHPIFNQPSPFSAVTTVAGPPVISVPIKHPDQHLVCYRIVPPETQQHALRINNQFGNRTVRTQQSDLLCVPSTKCELVAGGTNCSPTPTPTPRGNPCQPSTANICTPTPTPTPCIPSPTNPNCPPGAGLIKERPKAATA